jgi:flagellin
MRINYNVSSIIAKNALNNNDSRLSISTKKLSSGYKINSSKDDAAGLAIARKMDMQIKSLQRANSNTNDGLSVVNTADGAMSEMHSILQRMNELSVQAANGTNSDSDREQIQLEIDELIQEIDRIADTTQFNAQNLLDGSFAYKGYTNTENVKVMSYTDDVEKGVYILDNLTYYKYTDEKITYEDGTEEKKKYDRYSAESTDSVKNALVMDDGVSLSAYSDIENVKGFPLGSQVELDDENIIISDDKGFELKITLNDRDNVDEAGLKTDVGNTESVTIETYQDIKVKDASGNEYTISKLVTENAVINDDIPAGTPVTEITTLPAGTTTRNITIGGKLTTVTAQDIPAGTTVTNIYSGEKAGEYATIEKDLEDLGISNISNISVNGDTITIEYNGGADSVSLTATSALSASLISTDEMNRTKYTVVGNKSDDSCIQLDLTKMGAMVVQVGANEGQQLEIEIPALNAVNLGIDHLDLTTEKSATESINVVAKAIDQLSSVRARIGAYANRLEHTISNLDTTEENMTSSYSRIMDVDVAEEMTEYTSVQVLVQAATSVLAQANERPQQVLQLLQ